MITASVTAGEDDPGAFERGLKMRRAVTDVLEPFALDFGHHEFISVSYPIWRAVRVEHEATGAMARAQRPESGHGARPLSSRWHRGGRMRR